MSFPRPSSTVYGQRFASFKIFCYQGSIFILTPGRFILTREYIKVLKSMGVHTLVNTTPSRNLNRYGKLSENGVNHVNFHLPRGYQEPPPFIYHQWNYILRSNLNRRGEIRLAIHGTTNGPMLIAYGLLFLGKNINTTFNDLELMGGRINFMQRWHFRNNYHVNFMDAFLNRASHSRNDEDSGEGSHESVD